MHARTHAQTGSNLCVIYSSYSCVNQCKYTWNRLHPFNTHTHVLHVQNCLSKGDLVVPQPPLLQLSSANIDRHGAYLMDTGSHMYLWLGAAVSDKFCEDVFEQPNFKSIQDGMVCCVTVACIKILLLRNPRSSV